MVAEPQVRQPTFFDESGQVKPTAPNKPKLKVVKSGPLARGEFEPINPPNLAQESALWLTGQRSIAEQRGKRYVAAGVKHPGKMQPDVAGALIDTYTEPGWHIVDFMFGQGTTGVEGAERGRHVTGVELVRHWANVAFANACRTMYRGAPGSIRVICGDARALPELLGGAGADAVVTSPPYGEALEKRTGRVEGRIERLQRLIAEGVLDPNRHDSWARKVANQGDGVMAQQGLIASVAPEYDADAARRYLGRNWHAGPGQRAMEDPAYQADAAIVSPAYGDTLNQHPAATDRAARIARMQAAGIAVKAQDIGGPQSVTTAPQRYDAAVVSPAYGDIRQDGGAHQFGDGSAMENYTAEARVKSRSQRDQSNVGNKRYGTMDKALALVDRLKSGETVPPDQWPGLCYLEDMALIYWGAKRILKPGGLITLVLKDYRRDKHRVNLAGDTMRLLEAIGFIYHDRALALTSKIDGGQVISKVSPFVRVNARKPEKNGGKVMLPAGEEVLVFRKE